VTGNLKLRIAEAVSSAAEQAKSGMQESLSLSDLSKSLKTIVDRYRVA